MDSPLINVKNLRVSFFTKLGEVKAVDGLSYEIQKGKTLGIVGESGCGKSVASYAILGLLSYPGRIVGGEILFKGEDISRYTREQYENLRGNQITMVFQEALTALNPVLTIGYQITEQIERHLSYSHKQAIHRAVELMDLVGIPSPGKRLAEYPHQLSGGMKQRAMIAMALSCNPDLFIADEPTTALDVTIQAQILDLVQSLQERLHMTVQYITHDLGVVSELADDIIVMYAGRIVESGPNQAIFNNPRHPYTKGLLASIPMFKKRVDKLYTIPGMVPSPLELPPGCAFCNRCPTSREQCRHQQPDLVSLNGADHKVACFY
jgi:peptide/nickel transport system ATP-binding protein